MLFHTGHNSSLLSSYSAPHKVSEHNKVERCETLHMSTAADDPSPLRADNSLSLDHTVDMENFIAYLYP